MGRSDSGPISPSETGHIGPGGIGHLETAEMVAGFRLADE
jgi:hypothetical protein